jgi:hypothetical protein
MVTPPKQVMWANPAMQQNKHQIKILFLARAYRKMLWFFIGFLGSKWVSELGHNNIYNLVCLFVFYIHLS